MRARESAAAHLDRTATYTPRCADATMKTAGSRRSRYGQPAEPPPSLTPAPAAGLRWLPASTIGHGASFSRFF